jgi:periodic tryptophan protein 1
LYFQDEDQNQDDFKIQDSDHVLIAAKIQNEFSGLEIYVFEEQSQNLFVHHDLILSSFPVCLEWL